MKITRKQLQDIIIKESASLGMHLGTHKKLAKKKKSQIHQFSETKSGKRVAEAGQKIKKAGGLIREVGEDQVGAMAESLNNIAEFVEKMGGSLSGCAEAGSAVWARVGLGRARRGRCADRKVAAGAMGL